MKKHLIAAAVAAVVAVPAAAQVTVYGGIGAHVATVDTTSAVSTLSSGSNNLGSPVLGFRGNEDLGGGLKASFNLEGNLNTSDGNWGGNSSNANSNQIFDRQSWVGISGGFGAIKVGRTATATKDVEGVAQAGANLFDLGGSVDTYTDRFGSTVHYTTPSLNGFTASLSNTAALGATAAAPETGLEVNAYNVRYSAGPLSVSAGKADSKTAAGVSVGNTLFGASYNLGFATLGLAYQTEKATDLTTDKLTQIGAIVPLGKALALHANLAKFDDGSATATDVNYTGVMAVYSLSKRTRAFAGYRNDSFGSGGSASDATVTTAGVIHAF